MKLTRLLALVLACTLSFALAEEQAEYYFGEHISLTAPAGAEAEITEGVVTFVRGSVRTVAQLLPQDVSDDGLEQVRRLITVYDPATGDVSASMFQDGVYLARGVIRDCFGEGLHQYPALLLTEYGLLILSSYSLDGNSGEALAMLDELLAMVSLDAAPGYTRANQS